MSETTVPSAPPPEPDAPGATPGAAHAGVPGPGSAPAPARRLTRSRSDRMVAGVCGGLGAYFDVDPVIFRVLLAVLAVFGGTGLLLYGAAWLLLPEEGRPAAILQLRRGDTVSVLAVVVLAILVVASFAALGNGPGRGFLLLALLGIAAVVWARRSTAGTSPATGRGAAGTASAGGSGSESAAGASQQGGQARRPSRGGPATRRRPSGQPDTAPRPTGRPSSSRRRRGSARRWGC